MLSRTPLFVTLALLVASPALAQTAQPFSIQGSLLGTTVGGDAFEGIEVDPGVGFEAQVRWNPSAFSIGAGYQLTSHPATFDDDVGNTYDVDFTFAGIFLEPRYVIPMGSERAAPYVSARVMSLVATVGLPEFDTEFDVDARGWAIGGGFLFVLSPRLNMDLGLTGGQLTFEFEDGSEDTGSSLVARLGIALGI